MRTEDSLTCEALQYRAKRRGAVKQCLVCSVQYCPLPGSWAKKTCSAECALTIRRRRAKILKKASECRTENHRRRCRKYGVAYDAKVSINRIHSEYAHCAGCEVGMPITFRWVPHHALFPTLDHKTPLSRGGTHTFSNVQLLCWECNTEKGARTDAEWRAECEFTIAMRKRDRMPRTLVSLDHVMRWINRESWVASRRKKVRDLIGKQWVA